MRPVGIDELSFRTGLDGRFNLNDELLQSLIGAPLGAGAMPQVVVRLDDLLGRDDDRTHGERPEDGWRGERGDGKKPPSLQRQILAATPELQRRSDAAGCAEVG